MSTAAVELPALDQLYTVDEVARANRRSARWLKDLIKSEGIEHTKIANRIYFTRAQADALRARHAVTPVAQPVTTGKKKSP